MYTFMSNQPHVHICKVTQKKEDMPFQPQAKGMSKEDLNFRSRVVGQLKSLSELGTKVVKGDWGTADKNRVVADGLASTLECMVLTELTRVSDTI